MKLIKTIIIAMSIISLCFGWEWNIGKTENGEAVGTMDDYGNMICVYKKMVGLPDTLPKIAINCPEYKGVDCKLVADVQTSDNTLFKLYIVVQDGTLCLVDQSQIDMFISKLYYCDYVKVRYKDITNNYNTMIFDATGFREAFKQIK